MQGKDWTAMWVNVSDVKGRCEVIASRCKKNSQLRAGNRWDLEAESILALINRTQELLAVEAHKLEKELALCTRR